MESSLRLSSLAPFDLHRHLINHYVLTNKGATSLLLRDTSRDKRDIDIVREHHKFLWDEDSEPITWEQRLAKKYYDKLFKEYCICDLSRFRENKVAMRWQTEAELVSGKGQFICGEKRCSDSEGLRSWEVNFSYVEEGMKKNALVKLRLCPECSYKLNYKSKKREIKRKSHKRSSSESKLDDSKNKVQKTTNAPEENQDNSSGESKSRETQEEKEISEEERNIWKDNPSNTEERSRDEDFEDYLEQLLL